MSNNARRHYYPLVVFAGNSLTAGVQASASHDYPTLTLPSLPAALDAVNAGIGGQTTPQMIARAATLDAYVTGSRPREILVAWEGTNDLSIGASPAQAAANLVSYCQARRAAGFRVIILTVLPRTGATTATFEADRQTVNTTLRSTWSSFADALVDVGADATIGGAGATANHTYYSNDGIHLIDAGYAIVAGLVATAINSLL